MNDAKLKMTFFDQLIKIKNKETLKKFSSHFYD